MKTEAMEHKTSTWRWRTARWLAAIAGAIGIALVVAYSLMAWLVELPGPSGPYLVGQTAVVATDQARQDPWANDQPREVLIYVFYPASSAGSAVAYFPQIEKLARNFSGIDAWLVRLLPLFLKIRATENALPLAGEKPLPLVLFSPGAGAPVFFYRTYLEDLASHGYLVAAVEPTHEGVGQVFPDGSVREPLSNRPWSELDTSEKIEAYYRKRVDTRAADLRMAVDALAQDPELERLLGGPSRIVTDRVAVFGHSLGGVAAVEAARGDQRFVAAMNLDGHFAGQPCYSDDLPRAQHLEFLVIEDKPGTADAQQLEASGMTRENAERAARQELHEADDYLSASFGVWRRLLLKSAQHSDFSDEPFFYPQWTAVAAERYQRQLDEVRRAWRDLLQRRLISRPAAPK